MKSKLHAPLAQLKQFIPRSVIAHGKQLIYRLSRHQLFNAYSLSQAGQDHWVFAEAFNEGRNGFFVDLGAHDGISISNTYLLEKRYGWSGICIEANPRTFYFLRKNRSSSCVNVCIDEKPGIVSFVLKGVMGGIVSSDCDNTEADRSNSISIPAVRLDQLLKEMNAPSVMDYLSVDIEGAEDRALMSFPFCDYIFNCVTIERPSERLRKLLGDNGYLLVREVPGLDCFYIHSSFESVYNNNCIKYRAKMDA